MAKNDFVIQNNILRLFAYGDKQGKSLSSYLKKIMASTEMENLLSGYPYREDELFSIIDQSGRHGKPYGYEFYLYYSHCLIFYRKTTSLSCRLFPEWCDIEEIASRYDFYHTHSDEESFLEMCLARLRRHKKKTFGYSLFDYFLSLEAKKRLSVAEKILRYYFPYASLDSHQDYFDSLTNAIGYLYPDGKKLLVLDSSSNVENIDEALPTSYVFSFSVSGPVPGFHVEKDRDFFLSQEGESIPFSVPFRTIRP
jgi:hypothetical protein